MFISCSSCWVSFVPVVIDLEIYWLVCLGHILNKSVAEVVVQNKFLLN